MLVLNGVPKGVPTEQNANPEYHRILASCSGRKEPPNVTQDINVLALVKGEERYIFLFDDNHRAETLRTFGRYASNPELSFTWYDAAVLSQKLRQTAAPPKPHISRRFELPLPSDDNG